MGTRVGSRAFAYWGLRFVPSSRSFVEMVRDKGCVLTNATRMVSRRFSPFIA